MDIYVMDEDFETLDVIDYASSVIWTKRYMAAGDFEITVPACKQTVWLLQENRFLYRHDDDAIMIIKKIQAQTDIENGDKLIVSGPSVESVLGRRIIWEQTNLNGTVASGITQLLNENAINPEMASRKIDYLKIGSMCAKSSQLSLVKQITGDPLDAAISGICQTYSLGYRMTRSDKNLAFDIYSGADRSYAQMENPHVVFSEEFGNLLTSNYTKDSTNYKNTAMVAGEGEGKARKKAIVGNENAGWDRYEVFVDKLGISSNDGEISDDEYTNQLTEAGNEQLAEYQITESFESNVDPAINYTYGVDYFLGDIVQIETVYGMQIRARITEIIESEDENGYTCIPTFENVEV